MSIMNAQTVQRSQLLEQSHRQKTSKGENEKLKFIICEWQNLKKTITEKVSLIKVKSEVIKTQFKRVNFWLEHTSPSQPKYSRFIIQLQAPAMQKGTRPNLNHKKVKSFQTQMS
jgi:hypothetical protein